MRPNFAGHLLFLVVLLTVSPASAAVPLQVQWREGIVSDEAGISKLSLGDFDGNGIDDIFGCSHGAPFVLTADGPAFRTLWYGPNVRCSRVAVGDLNGDGLDELIVGTNPDSGSNRPAFVLRFDYGWNDPTSSVALPGFASHADVAAADVSGDPALEVIAVMSDAAYVINGASFSIQWTAAGKGGTQALWGDLNGDQQNEIIVNGNPAHVLDARTQTELYAYSGGFGSSAAVADVDGDGSAEIAMRQAWSYIRVLEGDTLQTKWTYEDYWESFDSVGVGDVTKDGIPEVLGGANQWGDVYAFRGTDGAVMFQLRNPEHGVPGITAGNVDEDDSAEVIWGAGVTSSGTDAVFVADVDAHVIQYQTPDLDGPWLSMAGDLDCDGRPEVIVATAVSDSGYDGGTVLVYDRDGSAIGTAPTDLDITKVAVGQFDADPQREIAVFGSSWYDPQFVVIDGLSLTIEYSSPHLANGIVDVAVANVDGDSIDEFAVGLTNREIHIYNGATPVIQTIIGPLASDIRDLEFADVNGDSALDLNVLTASGLSLRTAPVFDEIGAASIPDARLLAVAPANSGGAARFFVSTQQQSWPYSASLVSFEGLSLTPVDDCPLASGISALRWIDWGRSSQVMFNLPGTLFSQAPGAAEFCSGWTTVSTEPDAYSLFAHDLDGDAVRELIIGRGVSVTVATPTVPPYGDGDGDGDIDGADIFLLIHHVFSGGPPPGPLGDVDGNGVIDQADIDMLFRYLFENGPRPQ